MDWKWMLEKAAGFFVGGRTEGTEASKIDHFVAVAEIALAIAALDGVVRPEEVATCRKIDAHCAGLSDEERRQRLNGLVSKVGPLLMMAQIGVYSEAEQLAAFDEIVRHALPNGFAGCSRTDVRRAFVFWLAMAIADGEYADIERKAIVRLRERFSTADAIEPDFFETAERLLWAMAVFGQRVESARALDRLIVFSA